MDGMYPLGMGGGTTNRLNKMKPLLPMILLGLFLFSPVYADCPIHEAQPGRCLSAFYKDIDLNHDGTFESVKVISPCIFYTNLEEADWADDTGVVIVIFDDKNNEVFWDEVARYQRLEKVELNDVDKDGLIEIIITVRAEEPFEARNFIYGWNGEKIGRK